MMKSLREMARDWLSRVSTSESWIDASSVYYLNELERLLATVRQETLEEHDRPRDGGDDVGEP